MTTIVAQVVLGLFVLGVLVVVHELGHFLAAKLFGIRVLTFSIGFGKPLLARTVGGTEYRISSIPFGGFVHMAGEHPDDERENKPDEFHAKPIWQRAVVALAGPVFNLAFAVVFLWLSLVNGVERPLNPTTTVGYVADSSASQAAGFLPGDIILFVNGKQMSDWDDVVKALSRLDPAYAFVVERGSQSVTLSMPGLKVQGRDIPRDLTQGLHPAVPAKLGSVLKGSAAESAGLVPGDSVVAVDGVPVRWWSQLSSLVSAFDTTRPYLSLTVARNGAPINMKVVPRFDKKEGRCLIGITAAQPPTIVVREGLLGAIPQAFRKSWEMTAGIFDVLGKLVSHQVSPKQLAGPVGIVQMSGGIALMGLSPILNFMALIGINLALINLLPLVITDGGLLLFMLIEAVRRRPLSLKSQLFVNKCALAFFLLLFVYVTWNDIFRLPQLFGISGW